MGKSKSFLPKFNREKKFQKGILGTGVAGTLKEALGQKGKPLSMEQAYARANPYYSKTWDHYSSNCQRCVVAYELRRRGYGVTAQPTYKGDQKPKVAFTSKDGRINGRWMGAFQGAKAINVGTKQRNNAEGKVVSNINKKMRGFGNGSRGVVAVYWKNGGGHVFNVENKNGKIKAVEAQTGKAVSLKNYIKKARPGSVNLIRTDNLRVSERAKEFVTPERR